MRGLLGHFRRQAFPWGLVLVMALGWAFPGLGRAVTLDGTLKIVAIAAIFFFSGAALPVGAFRAGAAAWRLHLLVQGVGFLAAPLACAAALRFGPALPEGLALGFALLAAVPTTITSCVVFTRLAGGDTAAALLNAVGGNLLGIGLSPLLLYALRATEAGPPEPMETFVTLLLLVLLPLLLGRGVAGIAPRAGAALATRANPVGRIGILLIVLAAVSAAVPLSLERGAGAVLLPLATLPPAHVLLVSAVAGAGRLMNLPRPQRIAALFCAPQKTLALGLPLAHAATRGRPEIEAMALLPLILYHFWQLIWAAVMERHLRNQGAAKESAAPTA
jgi:sodium/bile acid cotransporter 7